MAESIDMRALKRTVLTRYIAGILGLGAVFFLTAWNAAYWEAWIYLLALAIPMGCLGAYLFKNDPKLLERRMRTREKREGQKRVIRLALIPLPLVYMLSGLDKRWGWSEVPAIAESIAFAFVLAGYLALIWVLKTNSYASRVIEVERRQRVISSGPYAIVRHPMYAASIVFYLATPIALGSYWALIPAALIIPVMAARILDEEKELAENLPGYTEYMRKVRYRMIPGIW